MAQYFNISGELTQELLATSNNTKVSKFLEETKSQSVSEEALEKMDKIGVFKRFSRWLEPYI